MAEPLGSFPAPCAAAAELGGDGVVTGEIPAC